MFIIIVTYRARLNQIFRRNQIISMINNINNYFIKYNIVYKIVICDQNNDEKFNRGQLLNIGFIEANKMFDIPKKYIHMNVDYTINHNMPFPKELLEFNQGVLEIHQPLNIPVLGACCCFDYNSYNKMNGFPNNLHGWGGDDWAALKRIKENNIDYICNGLFNSGWILEERYGFNNDTSNNDGNTKKGLSEDYKLSGLNNCVYNIDGFGEFHKDNVIHLLTSFT